jgi:hypothetical protein
MDGAIAASAHPVSGAGAAVPPGRVVGRAAGSGQWLVAGSGALRRHRLESAAAITGALPVMGLDYRLKSRRPDPAH